MKITGIPENIQEAASHFLGEYKMELNLVLWSIGIVTLTFVLLLLDASLM